MTDSPRVTASLRLTILSLLVMGGAAALTWPAIANGYPLVYMDTAYYVALLFGGAPHPGRAVGYGAVLAPARLFESLWPVVVVQAFVTSFLLVRVAHALGLSAPAKALVVIGVVLLSGAARYASWLMPDVLAAWVFLAGALWLTSSRPVDRGFAVVILPLSMIAHGTHLALAIVGAMAVAIAAWAGTRRGAPIRRAAAQLLLVALLGIPLSVLANAVTGGGASVSRATAPFLLNRFVHSGVLVQTLDRYCAARAWKACRHKAAFARRVGQPGDWFLFGTDSPFRSELGGWQGKEAPEIVAHAFRCCAGSIFGTTLKGTWVQFWRMDSADDVDRRRTTPAEFLVRERFPREHAALLESNQRSGHRVRVVAHPFSEVALLAFLAAAACVLAWINWKGGGRRAAGLIIATHLFLLANAAVCSFASTPHDRYQGRVAWLMSYAVFVGLAGPLERRYARSAKSTS